jgi:hypothetical protein
MADVKISGLPASTTPLTGAEVLPLVQGGVTKKVAVTNLTGTTVSDAGEVGIGGNTSGTIAGVTITSKFCVKQDGANPVGGFVKAENTTPSSGSAMFACRSRGTIASPTIVQDDDNLWSMYIAGNDGTDLALAAQITVDVDGTPGANDMPGRMIFSTTPDGSQAPVEALRLDSTQKAIFANPPSAPGYQISSGALITEATTSRTLSATDNGKIIYCTSGSATTITCAASLGAGFSVTIIQGGAGKVTVAAGAATLVSYSSLFSTMGQYAVISLVCPVANTFVAAGNLGV